MNSAAIAQFNRQTNERKNNLRNFIGLKQNNYNSGYYGVDYSLATPPVDRSDYVPCFEKGCTYKGPVSSIEFHNKTVHETGFDKELNVDNETWIKSRKKNFPTLAKIKENKTNKEIRTKVIKNDKLSKCKNYRSNTEEKTDSQDPLYIKLNNYNKNKDNEDILGLCAAYASSEEEECAASEDITFCGLPYIEELTPKQLQKRKNKYKFPILPQMELTEKRRILMNPQRKFLDTNNRRAKRPRLSEILCADDIISERNIVLQALRYLCNKRFSDPKLAAACIVDLETVVKQVKDEDEDIFKIEEAVSDDDEVVWSDCDL